MKTEISIIIPCYNQAQYLDECLDSVLNQIYQDWECIIVDDGSPDNTEETAKKWTEKDSRFKYLKKENGGISFARNVGIDYAIGKYILPLDADDKISTDYLSEAIKVFEKEPETTLVYCKAWLFDAETGLWDLPEYDYFELLFNNHIYCSAVFKKEDWVRAEGYDEKMKIGLEDWDFWLRILNRESVVVQLPIVGFFYRKKQVSRQRMFETSPNSERDRVINYIFSKQISVIETYFDKPFLYYLRNYPLLEKNLFELKNNHQILAKQVKISHLFRAVCWKLVYMLKRKLFGKK